eukprot:677073-Hanusia_phi.AAC.1
MRQGEEDGATRGGAVSRTMEYCCLDSYDRNQEISAVWASLNVRGKEQKEAVERCGVSFLRIQSTDSEPP